MALSRIVPLGTLLALSTLGLSQGGRPVPPGVRQADKAEDTFEKNTVPPLYQRSPADLAKIKRDAQELATLAQSVPPDIDQTAKGILPRDLEQRLKKIEKLAKELRSQISH